MEERAFASRAQQGWAFSTSQPFARKWADQTNFKRLPKRVKHDKESSGGEAALGQLLRGKSPKDTVPQGDLHERDFDKGVGPHGRDRDTIPAEDFAGPHRSFPITSPGDVSDALRLVGHAADPDAVRARIHAIAKRKGFKVSDSSKESETFPFGGTTRGRFKEAFATEEIYVP